MKQLAFMSLLDHAFRERQRAIDRYIRQYRGMYLEMARRIQPDPKNWNHVYSRASFAILSANAQFEDAVAALGYVNRHKGHADPKAIRIYGMFPAKATYCNAIPVGSDVLAWARQSGESYHDHRLRLWKTVDGLGLCKASFLTALLDPLKADVACLDTHMQKVYFGYTSFKDLSLSAYLSAENKVRRVAQRHEISTFLAQWCIWDHVRGKVTEHSIFPGSHK